MRAFTDPCFGTIGLIANNPQSIEFFSTEIAAKDFDTESAREIYEVFLTAYQDGEQLDESLIAETAWKVSESDRIYLYDALADGPKTLSKQFFADRLRARRWRKMAALQLSSASFEASRIETIPEAAKKSEEIVSLAQKLAIENHLKDRLPTSSEDLVDATLRKYDERAFKREVFSTGLKTLDNFLGGWKPGHYYVLGAYTGHGKTLFGTNFALWAAMQGKHTLYASIEMEKEQIMERVVCAKLGLSTSRMTNSLLTNDELDDYVAEQENLKKLPLRVSHLSNASLEELEQDCRRMNRNGKLNFLVLDYLQDLNIKSERFRPGFETISAVSTRLRNMAHALKIPVLALAQLGRQDKRESQTEGRIPTKSDLKGSGQIENDADAVLLIHHEFENVGLSRKPIRSLLVLAKNRHGPEAQIQVTVDFGTNRVRDGAS